MCHGMAIHEAELFFFGTDITKCFPGNFSALTKSLPLPRPPPPANHPLCPLKTLDNSVCHFHTMHLELLASG